MLCFINKNLICCESQNNVLMFVSLVIFRQLTKKHELQKIRPREVAVVSAVVCYYVALTLACFFYCMCACIIGVFMMPVIHVVAFIWSHLPPLTCSAFTVLW